VVTAWRIVKQRHAATAFDGEGARRAGGRWTSIGRRAVCTSGTIALATLEMLAHLGSDAPLPAYRLFAVQIPEQLIHRLNPADLPCHWMEYPAPPELLALGDAWLDSGIFPVLAVPSAVVGAELNYVLNPLHRDFPLITIGPELPSRVDSRLL